MGMLCIMSCEKKVENDPAYIGRSEIQVADGKMTPEVLLALGRLSDPQLSPDGSEILYGVTYTSIEDNRTCRNLFVCKADGSDNRQLTKFGKSVSNARWIDGGKKVAYVQDGQIWVAPYKGNSLGKAVKMSDVANGVSEFCLSPDESKVMYISTVPSEVKSPKDSDPALDKAKAYATEDLMYRHWDHWVTELPHTYVSDWKEGISVDGSKDILGGADVKFELPMEPFGGMDQLSWSPDGKYIAYSCKKLKGKAICFLDEYRDLFV